MVNVKERWAALEKKIEKFQQHHPEAKVICLAMIGNIYRYKGNELMEQRFAQAAIVQDAYRNAVHQGSQTFFSQGIPLPAPAETESLMEALLKHCFDMDMSEMRYLVGAAVTPASAPSAREKRRNFYDDMNNCPEWWRRTSVPFSSLNHPKAGQRRPTICEVYELIESLQDHFNIVPFPPSKQRRLDYRSRFHSSLTLSTSVPVSSSLPSSDSTSSASTPPASAANPIPTASTSHAAPPGSTFHAAPSTSTSHAAPPAFTSHAAPSPSTSHASPPGSTFHAAPPAFTSHAAPSASTAHTAPPAFTSHAAPSTSTSHAAHSASTSHAAPPDSTSHAAPSTSTSHAVPSASTSHSAPSTSTSHAVPSTSTSHAAPSASTSHTAPSTSISHAAHSASTSYPTTARVQQTETENLAYKREKIIALANESIQNNSLEILKTLGDSSWNDLLVLSDEVIGYLPEIPTSLSTSWKTKKLLEVNPRYIDFIPESVGKRIVLTSTSDGNCLFNSFSSVLYGDEECAFLLRVMFVVIMASKVLQYSKYIAGEYGDECQLWISAVSGSDYLIPEDLSFSEKIEFLCRQELLLTSKFPYRDCNLFHIHALSSILGRPVVNHFGRKGMELPFMKDIFPSFSELKFATPVHLLWVPSKPSRYGSLRHVVPVVCEPGPFGAHFEECAFAGLGICALTAKANPSLTPIWVECTLCGQWVHDVCMMVDGSSYKEEDVFICGCDRLIDGQVFLDR